MLKPFLSLGPQGERLISSTICQVLSPSREQHERRLSRTINKMISAHPEEYDSPPETMRPAQVLSIWDFIQFILVPHVATLLIADDMDIRYGQAVDMKDRSNDFGDMFNWDVDDPELVDLLRAKINEENIQLEPSSASKSRHQAITPSLHIKSLSVNTSLTHSVAPNPSGTAIEPPKASRKGLAVRIC